MKELSRRDIRFTIIGATGGPGQEGARCLLVGFPKARLEELLSTVRGCCRSYRGYVPAQALPGEASTAAPMIEALLGGAQIRVMDVDRFEQF